MALWLFLNVMYAAIYMMKPETPYFLLSRMIGAVQSAVLKKQNLQR